MPTDWITTQEAAALTGFHPDYVRKLMQAGKIKGQKWGRDWQVSKASLLDYVRKMNQLGEKRGPKGARTP
jgi:excisionase family DNA binding protein